MSGGKMRIHDTEKFVDCMSSADWTPASYLVQPNTATSEKMSKSMLNSLSQSSSSQKPVVSKAHDKAKKQREIFLEKQSVREHEFKMKFEVVKRENERRLKERATLQEREFDQRFNQFHQNNISLVEEVDGAIKADEAWRVRKKERLFDEWTLKVFQPMQDQINSHLSSVSAEEVETRKRRMFQSFLDESNKKANGLFRDIIIESDYDPLAQQQETTLRYKKVNISADPTKNRKTREHGNSMVRLIMMSSNKDTEPKEKRLSVPVEMWDKMEATPYGRYSNESGSNITTKPQFLKSQVSFDHYHIPVGQTGAEVLQSEFKVRGKRMMKVGPTDLFGGAASMSPTLPPIGTTQ